MAKAQIKDRTKQFDHTIKATTVTVSTGDSSTNIANTAWVKRQGYGSGGGGGTVTSVSGTSNRISSTGGTTPVIDIDAAYVGQTSITTLGTIGTGTWNATTIGLTKGGTGQTTANASFNALAPSQTSNSGKFLTTDGSNTSWATITAITASDTAAITSRAWRTNGNNMAGVTGRFGTTSNDHIDLITNNIVRGRLDAAGELLLGGTTDFGAFTFQNQAASWFSNGSSTAIVGNGDGVNNTLATFTWGIASNAQVNTIWTTPSSANTWEVHDFNSSTPIFTMGSDNNVALTHLITDASTSGKKWGYSARNTFNPTSGDAQRDAFLDSTTVNQTGGANGKYGSFHSILTKTACADCHGVWIENTDSWFGTTSGRVGIGISRATAPTAFLHLAASTTSAASLRLPSGTAPTSPNHGDMWTDADHIYSRLNGVTYQLDQQGGTNIGSSDLTVSANRTLSFGGNKTFTFDQPTYVILRGNPGFVFRNTGANKEYTHFMTSASTNNYLFGFTHAGSFDVGVAYYVDTLNNFNVGNPSTTQPLYTTGKSLYAAEGFLSAKGNFYKVNNITTNTTIDLTYYYMTVDATSGNVTITLPAASTAFGANVGILYVFQRIDNSGNTITVQRAGSDTINGSTSFTLTTQYETKTLICTSTSTWGSH